MPSVQRHPIKKRETPRPEPRDTIVSQFADEAERLVALGERVIGAVGGADALMRKGLDRIVEPEVKRRLERHLAELEQENGYLREVLMQLVESGPITIDREPTLGRLAITVDVRNRTIKVEKAR